MKKFIPFLFLLIPLINAAQELSGRWQEVKRWTEKDSAVEFYDSLRIFFIAKDSIKYQQKGTLAFIGRYKLLGNTIAVEDAVHFYITLKKDDELQLLYDNYKRKLVRVAFFSDERGAYDSVYINYGRKIDPKVFKGKWIVYKREGDSPGTSYYLLRSVNFNIPEASFYNWEETKTDSIQYSLDATSLSIQSRNYNNRFIILKADTGEIILKDEKLLYYLKPVK